MVRITRPDRRRVAAIALGAVGLALLAGAPAAAEPSFAPRVDVEVGRSPVGITSADFNRDGNPDLATANLNDANVSVLLGDGTGDFISRTEFSIEANGFPVGVETADVDADGKTDLLVTFQTGGDAGEEGGLALLLGDGAGGFASARDVVGGDFTQDVTSGHFNGDAHLDLAVTEGLGRGSSLTALMGDGRGGFTRGGSFSTDTPKSLVRGHFNDDDLVDLAITVDPSQAPSHVAVFLGNGGGFDAAVTYPTEASPSGLTTADLDGDGNADLATVSYDQDRVVALLGDGQGGFSPPIPSPIFAGGFYTAITSADLDLDGIPDVAVAGQGTDAPVLAGLGGGDFDFVEAHPTGDDPSGITNADLNRDGLPDLATANQEDDITAPGTYTVSVLLNTSTPPTPTPSPSPTPTPAPAAEPTPGPEGPPPPFVPGPGNTGGVDQQGPLVRVPASNKRLRASKAGTIRFKVGPAAENTTGVLSLKTAGKVRTRARKRRVALGTKAFQALTGQTVAVKLTLSRANRKLLRGAKRLRVQATITLRDQRGNATVRKYTFTMMAPRRR